MSITIHRFKHYALTALLPLVVSTGILAQSADDIYFDWPVGMCENNKFLPGYGYSIQQDYGNHNTMIGTNARCKDVTREGQTIAAKNRCYHAGLDIFRNNDSTNATLGDPVFAAADGRVAAIVDWNTDGRGVLIEHVFKTSGGPAVTRFVNYLHLDNVYVTKGQPVVRGMPIGNIIGLSYTNAHVHFEVRPNIEVSRCIDGEHKCTDGSNETVDRLNASCKGNGYALIPVDDTADVLDRLSAWGFSDPIDTYFDYRRPFPGQIVADQGKSITDCGASTCGQVAAGAWARSPTGSSTEEDDADRVSKAWYTVTQGEITGRIISYDANDTYTDLVVSEEVRVGRQWQRPNDQIIDIRFDFPCTENLGACGNGGSGVVKDVNRAELATTAAGTVFGALKIDSPYSELPNFCDKVGKFDGDSYLHVNLNEGSNFFDGVAVEASVFLDRIDDNTGEQVIAAQGPLGKEAWKFAIVREDSVNKLKFTTWRTEGDVVTADREIPGLSCASTLFNVDTCSAEAGPAPDVECPSPQEVCDDPNVSLACVEDFGYRQWRHVAVSATVEDGVQLFWDGRALLGEPIELGSQIVRSVNQECDASPIRIGDGLKGMIDNVMVWAFTGNADNTCEGDDGTTQWACLLDPPSDCETPGLGLLCTRQCFRDGVEVRQGVVVADTRSCGAPVDCSAATPWVRELTNEHCESKGRWTRQCKMSDFPVLEVVCSNLEPQTCQ